MLAANYDSGHAGVIPIMPDGRLGNPVTPVVRAGGQAHMIIDDGVEREVRVRAVEDGRPHADVPVRPDHRRADAQLASVGAEHGPRPAHELRSHPQVRLRADGIHGRRARHLAVPLRLGHWPAERRRVILAASDTGNGAHILAHPTRDFVYASLRASDIDIGVFRIGADGRLQAQPALMDGIDSPWDFDIDPSGQYMVVGEHSGRLRARYRINQDTGALTRVGGNAAVAHGHPLRRHPRRSLTWPKVGRSIVGIGGENSGNQDWQPGRAGRDTTARRYSGKEGARHGS